eukprot:1805174-Rhodomonas_salina.1
MRYPYHLPPTYLARAYRYPNTTYLTAAVRNTITNPDASTTTFLVVSSGCPNTHPRPADH